MLDRCQSCGERTLTVRCRGCGQDLCDVMTNPEKACPTDTYNMAVNHQITGQLGNP